MYNKEQTISFLKPHNIENYIIHDDLSVDVHGDVILYDKKLKSIPIDFGIVHGVFNCSFNDLVNLKGVPKHVEKDFLCSHNNLKSLSYSPEYIGGSFYCEHNHLTSLEGCTKIINGIFDCSFNYHLKSLQDGPEIVKGCYICEDNDKITLSKFNTVFDEYFCHTGEHIRGLSRFYNNDSLEITYKELNTILLNKKIHKSLKLKETQINPSKCKI